MKGILFTPDNRQKIIDNLKTQTRRAIKELKEPDKWELVPWKYKMTGKVTTGFFFKNDDGAERVIRPRYRVGETVYVKEVWALDKQFDGQAYSKLPDPENVRIYLKNDPLLRFGYAGHWRSPMCMPERTARYF